MVDCEIPNVNLLESVAHEQRRIFQCLVEHCNSGNTCRYDAWEHTLPDSWLVMLDDDNTLADSNILADIASALELAGRPDWATFPILRFGGKFFNDPPGLCLSDTLNVVVKREIGRWPNINDYTADGIWVEALKAHPEYTFKAFPEFRPIGVMLQQGRGER
jgi:hypothetical protein